MKAFKAYFLNLALREKVLLVAFILLIAFWWLSNFGGRAVRFGRDFHATSDDLKIQRAWLAKRESVEADAKRAIAQLDPSRTLDSTRLQSEINTLANGLPNTQIDPRPSERTDQFAIHSVQFSVRRVDFVSLERFYLELSKRAPYISIEQCSISADRATPAQLTATMQISSVEIVK
ncbi:MAG TPA: hypothetical protein VFB27_05395 [Opitutaceae bacterium]|nr:hypothetical protein [Opitutaceae bacterium]